MIMIMLMIMTMIVVIVIIMIIIITTIIIISSSNRAWILCCHPHAYVFEHWWLHSILLLFPIPQPRHVVRKGQNDSSQLMTAAIPPRSWRHCLQVCGSLLLHY